MRTSDNWPIGPPGLHFETPKLQNFDFNAIYSNADPDPASKNNADPKPGVRFAFVHNTVQKKMCEYLRKIAKQIK